MLQGLGSLSDWPWICALVAVSVVLDVFLPVLPSGVLLISAATLGATSAGGPLDVVMLLGCAATASVLGDVAAYRLAWRGGDWLDHRLAKSRRLKTAQQRLGVVLAHGGGTLVVLARFAPAGRSVVSLGAGAAHRRPKEFLPWSALAGLIWAAYSVGLGYVGGQWLGSGWLGSVISVAAFVVSGAVAAHFFLRGNRTAADESELVAIPVQASPADRSAVAEAR